jgi:hypothetical protein
LTPLPNKILGYATGGKAGANGSWGYQISIAHSFNNSQVSSYLSQKKGKDKIFIGEGDNDLKDTYIF